MLETVCPPRGKGENKEYFILDGRRILGLTSFSMPLKTVQPLVVDASAMANFVNGMVSVM